MLNYFILVGAFLTLFLLAFLPGLIELLRAKDPGPVVIDLDRDIDERYFAKAFNRYLTNSIYKAEPRLETVTGGTVPDLKSYNGEVTLTMNRGPETVWVAGENFQIAANTEYKHPLAVEGNLDVGDDATLGAEVRAKGRCKAGVGAHFASLAAADIELGANCVVANWIDAEDTLKISAGGHIGGRATAGKQIVVEGDCTLKSMAAPEIKIGLSKEPPLSPAAAVFQELSEPKWTQAADKYLMENYKRLPLEVIGSELERLLGAKIYYQAVLERANQLELIEKTLVRLNKKQQPPYIKGRAWLQSGEAVRVRGSVDIGDHKRLAAGLIIEGDLKTGTGVIFEGGVHVKGRAEIGDDNFFNKSLICGREVVIGTGGRIRFGCDSDGPITIGDAAVIGDAGLGGVTARGRISLESGSLLQGKVFSADEIKIAAKK